MEIEKRVLAPRKMDLRLEKVQFDQNQPRKEFHSPISEGQEKEKLFNRDLKHLLDSIEQSGLHSPLTVCESSNGNYQLIDGHRRYLCCEKLKFDEVPCLAYEKLNPGEIEYLRFTIQTNRKSWTPLERADSVGRIRRAYNIDTAKELSKFINASATAIGNSLLLFDAGLHGTAIIAKYGLGQTYCDEFIRLKPDFCKVKDIQPTEMGDIILRKVQNNVIKRAKDFRRIKKVFKRPHTHQEELHQFLTDPDMTVDELCERAETSGFILDLEKVAQSISRKLQNGEEFSEKKLTLIKSLNTLTGEVLKGE